MMTIQELAEEAFRDLLRKHNRPVDLKEALRRSAGASAKILPLKKRKKNDKKNGKKKRAKRRL